MKNLNGEWLVVFGTGAFLSSFVTSVAFFAVAHPKGLSSRLGIDPQIGNCTLTNKTPEHFQVKILKSPRSSGTYELYAGESIYLSCGDSILVTGKKYRSNFTLSKSTAIENAIPSEAKDI